MSTNGRLKLHWVTREHEMVGNALGYAHHNRMMKKYSEPYFEYDDTADVALHIFPADHFRPIPGKRNILFTMWEGLDIPPSYEEQIPKADAVIVPCSFCREVFRPYTTAPIEVCWEGVEPKDFPFHERTFPRLHEGERFRYLWVGAPNPRKGYPFVLEAIKIVEKLPQIEIYIKTTVQKINWIDTMRNTWRNRKVIFRLDEKAGWKAFWRMLLRIPRPSLAGKVKRFGKYKNIIFDTRKLTFPELIDLYNSAHCFVLPSMGEGWGLTLCEAMATGAPCIAVKNTGTADFFDDYAGYVIRDEVKELEFANYKFKGRVFVPDLQDFIRQMIHVFEHYDEAIKKGRKAHNRITSKFTWENSAKRLDEIIRKVVQS